MLTGLDIWTFRDTILFIVAVFHAPYHTVVLSRESTNYAYAHSGRLERANGEKRERTRESTMLSKQST
jgi:hypothetical protein